MSNKKLSTRIDGHWVLKQDTAYDALVAQGYEPSHYERRRGERWVYMTKEVEDKMTRLTRCEIEKIFAVEGIRIPPMLWEIFDRTDLTDKQKLKLWMEQSDA